MDVLFEREVKSMRIGISGAQSVGKTTLLNALRSESVFKDYSVCNEVTRRVQSYGLPINEGGNNTTQRLIMQEHIVNLYMHTDMITDRTSLDGYVYSQYLFDRNQISKETMDFVRKVFMRTISEYEIMFYIDPEFEIVDDGVRSADKEFQKDIVSIFQATISREQLYVTKLSGSVRERVQQVIDKVNMEQL